MALADDKHLALATVSGDVDLSTAQGRLVARLKGTWRRTRPSTRGPARCAPPGRKPRRACRIGRRAFGYLGDTRQPDPVTAPLVKQAYAAILAGASLADICRLCNDAGALHTQRQAVDGVAVCSSCASPVTPACAPTTARSSA